MPLPNQGDEQVYTKMNGRVLWGQLLGTGLVLSEQLNANWIRKWVVYFVIPNNIQTPVLVVIDPSPSHMIEDGAEIEKILTAFPVTEVDKQEVMTGAMNWHHKHFPSLTCTPAKYKDLSQPDS